jgi:acyl-CoA oxidase
MLPNIRADAVALVDAWDIPDIELQSQLGRKDGNAYESYFQWVMQEPVNQGLGGKGVIPGYEKYLKPMINGELAEKAKRVRDGKEKARL